jgi:hypothetical protein
MKDVRITATSDLVGIWPRDGAFCCPAQSSGHIPPQNKNGLYANFFVLEQVFTIFP